MSSGPGAPCSFCEGAADRAGAFVPMTLTLDALGDDVRVGCDSGVVGDGVAGAVVATVGDAVTCAVDAGCGVGGAVRTGVGTAVGTGVGNGVGTGVGGGVAAATTITVPIIVGWMLQ